LGDKVEAKEGKYLMRSLEIAGEDKKYKTYVQRDKNGIITGAVSFHKLPDSTRIETLGGLGGGTRCLVAAIDDSIANGTGGAITLTPVADSIGYYIKQGFDLKEGSPYGEYWLSPDKAKQLKGAYK
jgi:hypothetical protein